MKYEVNFSVYINEKYPDCWLWNTIIAKSPTEAIEKLSKRLTKEGKKLNCVLSVVEND